MASKLRQKKPPHVAVICLGAALSAVLGGLLALCHLAARPVEVVTSAPKEAKEGVRYFVQGASGGGKGWERKFEQMEHGVGEVGLTEGELNSWSSATFTPDSPAEQSLSGPGKIEPGVPNFRFDGDLLQIGAVNKLNVLGAQAPLVFQAKGGFARSDEGWRFEPSEAYLGGLALHRFPPLMSLVAGRFRVDESSPENLRTILTRATHVAVDRGELVVRVP